MTEEGEEELYASTPISNPGSWCGGNDDMYVRFRVRLRRLKGLPERQGPHLMNG